MIRLYEIRLYDTYIEFDLSGSIRFVDMIRLCDYCLSCHSFFSNHIRLRAISIRDRVIIICQKNSQTQGIVDCIINFEKLERQLTFE